MISLFTLLITCAEHEWSHGPLTWQQCRDGMIRVEEFGCIAECVDVRQMEVENE